MSIDLKEMQALLLDDKERFVIMTVLEVGGYLRGSELVLGDDLWWFREMSLCVRLGPWPYAVRAAHPMYPHIITIYYASCDEQTERMRKIQENHFDPQVVSRT